MLDIGVGSKRADNETVDQPLYHKGKLDLLDEVKGFASEMKTGTKEIERKALASHLLVALVRSVREMGLEMAELPRLAVLMTDDLYAILEEP